MDPVTIQSDKPERYAKSHYLAAVLGIIKAFSKLYQRAICPVPLKKTELLAYSLVNSHKNMPKALIKYCL